MKGRVWSNREKRYLSHDENFCLALAEYCDRSEERNIYRIVVCNPDWQSYDLVQDDDLIFELSSGLEDKNGKEICEGDILKFRGRAYEVKFDNYGQFHIENKNYHWLENEYSFRSVDIWCAEGILVEVIGNIHENPELLEHKR